MQHIRSIFSKYQIFLVANFAWLKFSKDSSPGTHLPKAFRLLGPQPMKIREK